MDNGVEREVPAGDVRVECWALIPARGGSKGIPRKNLKLVAGRSLVEHAIDQALASKLISRVFVSTDDSEIAKVAKVAGAEVIDRPKELAQDMSPDIDCFRHFIELVDASFGTAPELIVQLRPTSPTRQVTTIDECIALLANSPEHTSLRSVTVNQKSPYKMYLRQGTTLVPLFESATSPQGHTILEPYNQCRQVLPETYIHNGVIDIVRASCLRGTPPSMTGSNILAYVMSESIDIDTTEDLRKAELAMAQKSGIQ
mmetsp:Transcript_4673/g.16749  ORF Transcript_4673/g.16749 Transcript_4673/m.16749 type:complete len:257 (-) Transcript_4673:1191-1961(-)